MPIAQTYLLASIIVQMVREHEVSVLPVLVAAGASSQLPKRPLLQDLGLDL